MKIKRFGKKRTAPFFLCLLLAVSACSPEDVQTEAQIPDIRQDAESGAGENAAAENGAEKNAAKENAAAENGAEDGREALSGVAAESAGGIPEYTGEPYVIIDGNLPDFTEEDKTFEAFEYYSELDSLGRCQTAYANICKELMPTEKRGSISQVKPTGWQTSEYDFVDGKHLYNRCHLIGFQLAGENANEKNLITGTRYMNVDGMLPFENEVAEYVKETDHHVLYRVTPVFDGENLVASGVEMEAWSVEDAGDGVCFHVYVYNVQPGVVIDYATGDNQAASEEGKSAGEVTGTEEILEYVLNTNTLKFHLPDCASAEETAPENRAEFTGTRSELLGQGYSPCKRCKP